MAYADREKQRLWYHTARWREGWEYQWQPGETAALRRLLRAGLSYIECARRLGRAYVTVRLRAKALEAEHGTVQDLSGENHVGEDRGRQVHAHR